MERIKELNRYQKGVLLLLALMLVVFTVLYPVISSRVGLDYGGKILVPREENGATVYSGGDTAITVTADKTVTVQQGSKVYGPYTAKEDPTAIPADHDLAEYMTGVEILEGDRVFFRGGVFSTGDGLVVRDEDWSSNVTIGVFTVTMQESDMEPQPPSAATILELMDDPELTSHGQWAAWAAGVFITVLTAVTILFADELFYWSMSFKVADPYTVEPSEWVIASRYIEWTALPVMALAVFIIGLMC